MRLRILLASLLISSLACAGLDRAGGVLLPNQMDEHGLRYLREKDLLEPGEELRAYYDVTVSLDGSEIAMVTDRRVVYHKEGITTAIPLSEVRDVRRVDVPLGDGFLITGDGGRAIQVEIAAMNGGETWASVLDAAVASAR